MDTPFTILIVALAINVTQFLFFKISGSGELEFEEFVTLASRFMVEEDAEAMQQELKEAFRLYDKEGNVIFRGTPYSHL